MSYTESDAYEKIAEAVEEGHCKCYHIKSIVISMTEKQLSHPQITKHEKERLEKRLNNIKQSGRKGK